MIMRTILKKITFGILLLFLAACQVQQKKQEQRMPLLEVSDNGRYFQTEDGKPFFWLGDTGWLLFTKLTREEANEYLSKRKDEGYNVIQVMVLHSLNAKNIYGDSALINKSVAHPLVSEGNDFNDSVQYDFWDNVDYVVHLAEEKGLYMAMVPVWGNNVRDGHVSRNEAATYAKWLGARYKGCKNIIWLNGGDTFGNDSTVTWNIIGDSIKAVDPNHLMTFHPRGRCSSSDWFQNADWLDFNMIQSGHRRYDQDDTERGYGQDNWRYIVDDYKFSPAKPTIDGEPSYEGIPQGLHDVNQPFWNADDVRRYAYWSVFSGAFGFTYGHSAVMQFYNKKDKEPAYGAKLFWREAMNEPGAKEMMYIKQLMMSYSYFDRVPAQDILASNGEKYAYKVATKGKDYAMIYTYNGDMISVSMNKLGFKVNKAQWFNPKDGKYQLIENIGQEDVVSFDPPGEVKDGNDWVLVLE